MSVQQKNIELLTYGYVRENYPKPVPIALVNLCKLFYNEYIYWIIKGDELEQFRNYKKGEFMTGPEITIHNIPIYLFVFPKGSKRWNNGDSVGLGVASKVLPENVDNVQFYARICCENTGAEIKFFNKSWKGFAKGFQQNKLQFNECLKFDALYFNLFMDIKAVIYKLNGNNKLKNYISINKMRKFVRYTWNIDDKLIEKFKNVSNGTLKEFHSPNFDGNNWCLVADARGIALKLLYIPNGISSLIVKYRFNNKEIEDQSLFDTDHCFSNDYQYAPLSTYIFDEISVSLLIIQVIDDNGNKIHQNHWSKYGIIDYVYCPFIDCC